MPGRSLTTRGVNPARPNRRIAPSTVKPDPMTRTGGLGALTPENLSGWRTPLKGKVNVPLCAHCGTAGGERTTQTDEADRGQERQTAARRGQTRRRRPGRFPRAPRPRPEGQNLRDIVSARDSGLRDLDAGPPDCRTPKLASSDTAKTPRLPEIRGLRR